MRCGILYSNDSLPDERRLVDVVDEKEELDDLADHGLAVELVVLHLHPGAQHLQQVREQVNVPSVLVELLHDLPCQDRCQLRDAVLQARVQLVVVVQSEVTDADKASNFKFTEVLIDEAFVLSSLSLLYHLLVVLRRRHRSVRQAAPIGQR